MNIVLTQKDADFILSYLRSHLTDIDDGLQAIKEEMSERQTDSKNDEETELILEFADSMLEQFSDAKQKVIKAIELLTIGSEGEN